MSKVDQSYLRINVVPPLQYPKSRIIRCVYIVWHIVHETLSSGQQFTVKTCVKRPLSKRTQIGFQDKMSFTAGQNYCRMLKGEYSTILPNFIRIPFVIKIFYCRSKLLQNAQRGIFYNTAELH